MSPADPCAHVGGARAAVWEARLERGPALLAATGGLAAVVAGWLALLALGAAPTTTFVERQLGGVPGEVAVFALVGAALGMWWASRPVR